MRRLPWAALLLLGGCYSYAPVQTSDVQAGATVRARLTPTEAGRVAPLLGAGDARVITGTLIETGPNGVIVEVPMLVPGAVGNSFETLHQRISVPKAALVEFEARKLDRLRTGAVVSAAAVVAGTILYRSIKGDAGRDRAPTGGSTDSRIPR